MEIKELGRCRKMFLSVLTDQNECNTDGEELLEELGAVKDTPIASKRCWIQGDSSSPDIIKSQIDMSSLLREMTVGIGGVCSLTSEVLASLNQGVPPLSALTGKAGSELASPSSGET
ncbi:hypothetical protein J6590_096279 [Homalodisca vitripennis]|nr:hypothetical protein J6590_072588 [Homalodisca vitripennis]KAG8309004.1 hypothetical protein J6590_096279 [Homalodisca vitripennis]